MKYKYPVLWLFVEQWPALILVPAVLSLIVVLAMLTRRWDQRDEMATDERPAKLTTRSTEATSPTASNSVGVS